MNYVESPPGSHLVTQINPHAPSPFPAYPHPDRFRAARDRMLQNAGDGRYAEVSAEAGTDVPPGKGLGVAPTDLDLDGWVDLYVANDSTPNFLFHNRGGSFEETGGQSGAAFNDSGRTEAGMGVDGGDVDGDGDFDLFVTNLDLETNTLYVNSTRAGAAAAFRDRTRRAGLAEPSRLYVGFGALFFDADRDGHLDLLVANGHIIDNVEAISDNRLYAQPNQLFLGDGAGRFARAGPERVPEGLGRPTVSRGSAAGDVDGDGDLDFVLSANGQGPQVFLGTPPAAPWLELRLAAGAGNPRGLGSSAWVELEDGRSLLLRVESARSYASASAPAAVTGLPAPVRAVEVLWPGGERERWEGFAAPFEGVQLLERGSGAPAGG